jgi:DNA-binding response OmpR family regulator
MRILLVEDEEKVANFIKKHLKEEGFSVDISPSCEDAEEKFEIEEYCLLIVDLILPDRDGLNFCKEVREKNKNIPVLILTCKDRIEDKVEGLKFADDYLTKPFSLLELTARIRALLRRKKQTISTELKFTDLKVDLLTHKVTRGEKEISLSYKEFLLLEYFLRNPNTLLTRGMILENAWGEDIDKFTNIVDVYVSFLRKKIDEAYDKKLIHTVKGFGYILKDES